GIVRNSYASGDVILTNANGKGISAPGGLVGQNNNYATVMNSFAAGNVTSPDASTSVGGLVGSSLSSYIVNSHATGDVYVAGGSRVGGLVGYNAQSNSSPFFGLIDSSYASGNVVALTSSYVGGLVGYNYGSAKTTSISNSYYAAAKAPVEVAPDV